MQSCLIVRVSVRVPGWKHWRACKSVHSKSWRAVPIFHYIIGRWTILSQAIVWCITNIIFNNKKTNERTPTIVKKFRETKCTNWKFSSLRAETVVDFRLQLFPTIFSCILFRLDLLFKGVLQCLHALGVLPAGGLWEGIDLTVSVTRLCGIGRLNGINNWYKLT